MSSLDPTVAAALGGAIGGFVGGSIAGWKAVRGKWLADLAASLADALTKHEKECLARGAPRIVKG